MANTTANNSRLDDDARHLTQDYPAFGENLSRTSSRSSTVSQASRSAYPGVPEDVLERVSQAKSARIAARKRYETALATRGLSQSVILELEDRLLKTEDELKLARIERTHAKFSSPHVNSPSRSPLPSPLPMPSPSRHPPQSLLRPVPEKLAPLLQGEDLRCRGGGTGVYEDVPRKTADKLNLARTECDSAQLLDQRVVEYPNVFAIGDVADTGAHKAAKPGSYAQAEVVARNIEKMIKVKAARALKQTVRLGGRLASLTASASVKILGTVDSLDTLDSVESTDSEATLVNDVLQDDQVELDEYNKNVPGIHLGLGIVRFLSPSRC
ncbi:hypothetical protein K435DRAFT_903526 [Dendrothele bispora CBS 962.96]|uniref:FAD/NAD(P)-binding domain-containing protein n=1 Tax=Dendrothele bispora (strain CBS 962.96) TaxID=1314807 RepID=A0A4S8LWH1_DENBC|nr:hypothetical protein K435DRAFT_903526 [Dendrothele bispora CBS 962.96]